jgi:DNA polymerase-4
MAAWRWFHILQSAIGILQTPVSLRRILHVDMDAFYASVEQRDNPDLRGRPVAVGGRPEGRGVVAAASYEARRFGVRSAISMARALRLCPELIVVQPDFSKYRAASHTVFDIFREVTPLVEPLSLDEAYLDVTENSWNESLGMNVAKRLKSRILAETGLTASAGVAPNKFLAKIASGWQKPDGLTVIAPDRVEAFLQKLPVEALWGVGPVTARRLRARGIERLVDVRSVPADVLREAVGNLADWLVHLSQGIDDRPVTPHREARSSGSEQTYAQDLVDWHVIEQQVRDMALRASAWLDRRELLARTVTVKVRYHDFTTVTRRHSGAPTRDGTAIAARAVQLLHRTDAGRVPVRLLGVSVQNFCRQAGFGADDGQLPFADAQPTGTSEPC